ncbi:MAG: TonB-dependent receptor [Prevotella sp.]|nr:TonB-dependent receptor [Prevotella sp.]MCM1074560.1 TonB-dependent receptor [Ruminococcus sp.]
MILTSILMAAGAVATDTVPTFYDDLDEVVVTGTRAPKLLKDVPVQTTVITAKDIERTDATNIEELLQQQMPGVEFSYAMNQQVHMNFGGFGGQGVLFLVDGERLAGETMDDVDFSRLDMGDVERIEIVRGASSALYGGNAAGGVINIITKEPRKKWSANVNARIGRHDNQRYGGNFSFRNKRVSNTLTATYSRISSYDVKSSPDPLTRVVTTIYGNRTLNVRDHVSVTPFDVLKLTARAGYFFREIPRILDTPERYRDYSAGLKGTWQFTDADNIEVAYSFDQYDKSSYMRINGLDVRNYSDVINSVRGVWSHTFNNDNVLTLGADYRYDYLNNTKLANGAKHEANADAFAQFDWVINEKWEVVGAARYDYFSSTNTSRVTPKITGRYKPTDNTNVRLGYGMGFRTPTLKERFYNFDMAGIWIVEGNPNLKPESSQNVNASFDWTISNYTATVTGYYNNVENKIATGLPYYKQGEGNQLFLQYINLDRYSVYGFEATVQARWACGLSGKLSYAFTHENFLKDKEGNTANNQYIPSREHTLTANLEWQKNFAKDYDLTLGVNGRVLSGVTNIEYKDYYDIAAGTVDVHYPAYTLWKLSAALSFRKHVKITLAADNIFNYKPKYYYLNAPLTDGIDILAGIAITI